MRRDAEVPALNSYRPVFESVDHARRGANQRNETSCPQEGEPGVRRGVKSSACREGQVGVPAL